MFIYIRNNKKKLDEGKIPQFKYKDIELLFYRFVKENIKLSNFLKILLKNYDKTCEFFYYIYNEIFRKLKLYDFHGKSFYMNI